MDFQATEENVRLSGRSLFIDGVRYLTYSGSSISFTFTGKCAEADILSDAPDWDEPLKGWVAVYINGETEPRRRILLDKEEALYTLFESETEQTVTVRLMKYSEAAFGKCGVRFLRIDTDKLCPPPASKPHRIEIIGDSITCGYGVEAGGEGENFRTDTENPAKSYSLRLAAALDAEAQLVSWSGIGVISGWVEEDAAAPSDDWLMPMIYQYTDAAVSMKLYGEDRDKWEKWDFSSYVPELIIINLGTNDTSWCKDIRERREDFGAGYERFLNYVAEHNPKAHILCTLGTMEQGLCPVIERIIEKKRENGASGGRYHYIHLPLQRDEDGKGADLHPSDVTQQKTAALLAAEAKRIMGWEEETE